MRSIARTIFEMKDINRAVQSVVIERVDQTELTPICHRYTFRDGSELSIEIRVKEGAFEREITVKLNLLC